MGKDSSADLGVNFKIVQNRPTFKSALKYIKKICLFVNIFIFLRENRGIIFLFLIFKLK